MYKNKNGSRNNIVGISIRKLRLAQTGMSQRILADKMQLVGIDLNKNAIQRIESGERFVTDIELKHFAEVFGVTPTELYERSRE
ncbi:MAG: helix-turn-helix domain-containing protein [Bacteroidales bacterium]|nr:helix-turn-helix domain-containing protein [Clostridium sp.]MCM1203673.1 helix-turn-helix domain-containing protein [Bacteroidales bacterium]